MRDIILRELVNYIVDGFTNGFELGMTKYPVSNEHDLPENSKTVHEKPLEAQKLVDAEIQKGHILGPFDEPPLLGMFFLSINIVEIAGRKPDKYRLIHNLAYPYDAQNSVNACIPQENSKVKYRHIDEVIDMALKIGISTRGIRADVSHAFHNLSLKFSQLKYMGFTLNGKYYINSSLLFGAASSCLIFKRVATLLEWIVVDVTGREYMLHYLDDYSLFGKIRERCQ